MGKAADNEKLKLRATFFNNIAVAFLVTGFVVPYLAFLYKAGEHGGKSGRAGIGFLETYSSAFTKYNVLAFSLLAVVAAFSGLASMVFRRWANRELDRIID